MEPEKIYQIGFREYAQAQALLMNLIESAQAFDRCDSCEKECLESELQPYQTPNGDYQLCHKCAHDQRRGQYWWSVFEGEALR